MSKGNILNLKCEICGKEMLSTKSMSHIPLIHKITVKDYYDKFLRKPNEGFCIECGKETKFLGIFIKYQKFCSLKCSNQNQDRINLFKISYKENDLDEIKSKREETNLKRFGDKIANRNIDVKRKTKDTCMKRYGFTNPMMSKNISKKSYSNRKSSMPYSFKWKEYKFPSGEIVKIQGKENKTLDKLLKVFDEKEIYVHKGVPTIFYIDINGVKRKHFPDIYIKKLNWIFECKCNYTWNPDEETRKNNILKFKEAKKQGFNYNVIIE